MSEQVIVGRQQGQVFTVVLPSGQRVVIETLKCRDGYVKLLVESKDSFVVERYNHGSETIDRVPSVPRL